ncbi:hypothetical protein Poly30_25550 [Planctomycetes bacterium Poly30]|uniref:Uncharacterized protein n=1 Tax=Saltatorellus ferox TaxID=2528018 RepID=A0A518ESH0_9BACT|nr:hypothetical protein Poly30_25550 [Planctomycetes bacterium Poly30]
MQGQGVQSKERAPRTERGALFHSSVPAQPAQPAQPSWEGSSWLDQWLTRTAAAAVAPQAPPPEVEAVQAGSFEPSLHEAPEQLSS